MEFPGFDAQDFELFAIPDFAGRMGEIRARLRPKLAALGADLAGPITACLDRPAFPHVAQHMRRRVHPPPETWVAFARDRKGYKRWTHLRVAVSGSGVRVTVFVEDDADDKPRFGARLAAGAGGLLAGLSAAPVEFYTLEKSGPVPVSALDIARLEAAGAALQRLKTLKFQAGVALTAANAAALSPDGLQEWALQQVAVLRPLYFAGAYD